MRRLVAALAMVLSLSIGGQTWAILPHYELESELTGEFPIEAHFEHHLEYRKPSPHTQLEHFLKQRHVREPSYYAALIIRQQATKTEKAILAALLPVESFGNADAVSPTGCVGPWQVHPSWKRILNIKGDLKNPEVNVVAALGAYRTHLADANGHERRALRLYGGGPRYPVAMIEAAKATLMN